jgi:hypothetical protein
MADLGANVMGSNSASGASSYRQRAESEASRTTTADILRIAEYAGSAGMHLTEAAADVPLRPEPNESKASSAADDLPDHIRKFCQRFLSSDNRSLF